MTPGASTALVTRNAIGGGRTAAFFTTTGIVTATTMYAVGSALGLSFILARSVSALQVIKIGGATYLTFLGLQTLWRAIRTPVVQGFSPARRRRAASAPARGEAGIAAPAARPETRQPLLAPAPFGRFTEGLITNLLNPPVALFYITYVPQFVRPDDPHFRTFMTLSAIHIGIAFAWLSLYGTSIGSLGTVLARPRVKRTIEAATGLALVVLAWRLGFAANR